MYKLKTMSKRHKRKFDDVSKYEPENGNNFFDNSYYNDLYESAIKKFKPIVNKEITIEVFNGKIESLDDLILLASSGKRYSNIDVRKLRWIKSDLIELNNMIGLKELKKSIFRQLIYYIQDIHKGTDEFMNIIITGPPGTGKSCVALILGRIFGKLGILESDVIKSVTIDDFVAGFVGQTELKTRRLLEEVKGGVCFFDEAYSLGSVNSKPDSFKEVACNILCDFMSKNKGTLFIFAGYEEEIKSSFLSLNKGMDRRIMWKHKMDEYKPIDLADIFIYKVKTANWEFDDFDYRSELEKLFKEHKDKFKNFGGDVENFFVVVRIEHSQRVLLLENSLKKKISKEDITNSVKNFKKKSEAEIDSENKVKELYSNLYM